MFLVSNKSGRGSKPVRFIFVSPSRQSQLTISKGGRVVKAHMHVRESQYLLTRVSNFVNFE